MRPSTASWAEEAAVSAAPHLADQGEMLRRFVREAAW